MSEAEGFSGEPVVLSPHERYLGNPNLPAPGAQFSWTPEMIEEVAKCSKDIFHFAQNYFYITTLDEGKKKIKLFKAQIRVLKSLLKNRFVIVLSSRQAGKTTLMTIYALWLVCFKNDQRVLIVANKEDTAIKIFRRIRQAYELLPVWLKPTVHEWGKTGFVLGNDSSIGISTTTSDAARGDTVNCLIIDEMASIPTQLTDEFWKSTIPVISSSKQAKIFAVSTPRGTGNKFYEVYTEAEQNKNGWHSERIDWWDVPGRNEKWRQDMINTLGSKEAFDEEFGNVFTEAGQAAIDVELIEEFKKKAKKPRILLENGNYKVFKEPIEGHIYTIGVDVGEGIGQAASVIQVFDITDLTKIEQTAIYHTNKLDPHTFAGKVYMVANSWGRPPLLIERNNCGGQVIDALLHIYQYSNLVDFIPDKKKIDEIRRGIYSHTNSRYKGVMNMRYWVNTLQSVYIPDIATVQELETFIRHPNGTWHKRQGKYDDRILAMIWSLFALETEVAEKYYDIVKYDEKGKPLKIASLEPAGKDSFKLDKTTLVGEHEPLPLFLGVSAGKGGADLDLEELEAQGWKRF